MDRDNGFSPFDTFRSGSNNRLGAEAFYFGMWGVLNAPGYKTGAQDNGGRQSHVRSLFFGSRNSGGIHEGLADFLGKDRIELIEPAAEAGRDAAVVSCLHRVGEKKRG